MKNECEFNNNSIILMTVVYHRRLTYAKEIIMMKHQIFRSRSNVTI